MAHILYQSLLLIWFQSLFSWNLLLMPGREDLGRNLREFQSLFSWNLLLMWICGSAPNQRGKFQSLFSWNLLLMQRWVRQTEPGTRVSILVFVELALDGHCQTGWTGQLQVSILVFVELALDVDGLEIPCKSVTPFQSLFSWNLLLMFFSSLLIIQEIIVSILVFVELALDDSFFEVISFGWIKFQSLFSWNLLLMFENEIDWHEEVWVSILVFVELALDVQNGVPAICAIGGFNPCFRGTCSWWVPSGWW